MDVVQSNDTGGQNRKPGPEGIYDLLLLLSEGISQRNNLPLLLIIVVVLANREAQVDGKAEYPDSKKIGCQSLLSN